MSAVLPRFRFLAAVLFVVIFVFLPTASAEERPLAIGINTVTNRVYVVYNGSSYVAVFDGATLASEVTVGANPVALAVNPITNTIYVANSGTNDVTVIDGSTLTTTAVSVGSWPQALAVNPETNKIYVANNASASITVIDGATNTTTTISVGLSPQAVAINPVTNKIYVANNGSNNVSVIDGATNSVSTVSTGQYPYVVAVNPVTNKIYVGDGYGTITVIDGATNRVATVNTAGDCVALTINQDSNKIYVVSETTNKVTVIDGASNATSTVDVGPYPLSVAVNSVTNTIYVANFKGVNLTVIDGPTNGTTTVDAGEIPELVVVNPLTNKVYVANWDHFVTEIDGVTAGKASPGMITSPVPGTQLAGSSATFQWSAGTGITYYQLWIGVTEGSHDLKSVPVPAGITSYTADNLPTAGQILYVRLNSIVNDKYLYNSYMYTAAGKGSDTNAPTVAITAPAAGSTVSGSSVTLSANATDNVGVVGVQFKLDGLNLGPEDTTAPYAVSWNTTAEGSGTHTLTAVARDAAGNSSTSAAVTVTVNNAADTTPPTVAITVPVGGSTVSGTSVTVSATATDNVGVVGVQFKLDGANLGAEIIAAPYSLNWNTTTVTNGTHGLTVSARDAAGHIGVSVATTVTISNSTEFAMSVPAGSSSSATTTAGGTATYSLNVSPSTGFAGPVSFVCTGMPQATTCTLSPNPATVSGLSAIAITATVKTTRRSTTNSSVIAALPGTHTPAFATLSLSVLPAIVIILQVPRRRRTRLGVGVAALVLLFLLVGCGGGGSGISSMAPPPPTQTGTPAGTYTITVSGAAGSVTHSFDLKLTVN